MADSNEPRILRPDGNIPASLRDREERANAKSPTIAQTREWIVAGVATGAKNIYDQLSAEAEKNMEKMEQIVVDRVLLELERRSWRGRIKLRWLVAKEWARNFGIDIGLIDPTSRPSHVKLESSGPVATPADPNAG